jgi:hypothetical protein
VLFFAFLFSSQPIMEGVIAACKIASFTRLRLFSKGRARNTWEKLGKTGKNWEKLGKRGKSRRQAHHIYHTSYALLCFFSFHLSSSWKGDSSLQDTVFYSSSIVFQGQSKNYPGKN